MHRQHAEQLQTAIDDMNAFFKKPLGVQANGILALLDSKNLTNVTGSPYGLAIVRGTPPVIFMPATRRIDCAKSRLPSMPAKPLGTRVARPYSLSIANCRCSKSNTSP